jgi:translation initiation factor IF-2
MNISTLAKILGVSINELRNTGKKNSIQGFNGRNTRIPYQSALDITKIIKPDKIGKLENDDKIYLPNSITVNELSEVIGKPAGMVVKTLLLNGVMATLNEKIDYDTAALISEEMGVVVYPENPDQFEKQLIPENLAMIKTVEYDMLEKDVIMESRPPVVTIMGHVDHGKTTLLDKIRHSNIVSLEAGSITQHISSYQIEFKNHKITFIDTPGHAAFTAMRARGTQLADFIILVVAATEGPKPQTVEVIERAKLTKTPLIVAINKIDLPDADTEKVKTEIAAFGIVPEEWGGDTPFINISAVRGDGVEKILETILLHAEVADLKGQVNCQGQGVVLESNVDPKLGVTTTVLITKDKIKVGDFIKCGEMIGKVRALENAEGKKIQIASIAMPVLVSGLSNVCNIGEVMIVYPSKKEAVHALNQERFVNSKPKYNTRPSFTPSDDSAINLILKADVNGSLEALKESILKIPQDKVKVQIKSESVGEVTENDIDFAKTTKSTILAFHTHIHKKAATLIEKEPVDLMQSDIIYELLEWVEEKILSSTKHEIKTTILGKAEILGVFKSDRPTIQIFGGECKVGKIFDNKEVRIVRDGENLGKFEILELQKNKQKVKEVNISQQFGMSIKSRIKIQVGDILESIDEMVVSS